MEKNMVSFLMKSTDSNDRFHSKAQMRVRVPLVSADAIAQPARAAKQQPTVLCVPVSPRQAAGETIRSGSATAELPAVARKAVGSNPIRIAKCFLRSTEFRISVCHTEDAGPTPAESSICAGDAKEDIPVSGTGSAGSTPALHTIRPLRLTAGPQILILGT